MNWIKKCTIAAVFLFIVGSLLAQNTEIASPKSHFGFSIGEDYQLVNYTQAEAYFKKLAQASDRVTLKDIGKTEEGRTQYVMVISSPENLKQIDHYKDLSQRLARAEGIDEEEAKRLSKQGKAVVWIDGGLHSNEMVGSHQLIELYYQLLTNQDDETKRILDDVIILLSHVNPDGQELMANWYMQETDPEKRNMRIPRLYQKYIGHDNNRDFYMMNMKETTNIAKQQYVEWMPQIIYNHHQSSPAGAVVAGPPYRDPFNFVFDPLLITGIDGVGAAMINRVNREGKSGYTRLSGAVYSTWWNGGLRTTPYFHNMIGLLTEMTGTPGPSEIAFVPERLIPNNATPNPVRPQPWKFRQSIDYSISLNYAVLDYASRNSDQLLYSIYKMGKNAIDKGNGDHWSLSPKHIEGIRPSYEADVKSGKEKASRRFSRALPLKYYEAVYQDPKLRDPRGFILSSAQEDFPTAVKFINTLIKSGVKVEKSTSEFTVQGKNYPAGSYIVKTNQAFRPHVLDMFEPQDHPNDFLYPGGPPIRPYDAAGWTLAYQMGVTFDRILTGFEGPFEPVEYGQVEAMPPVNNADSKAGYLVNAQINNAYILVNELLKNGIEVHRINQSEKDLTAGSFYIPAKGAKIVKQAGLDFGVKALPITSRPKSMTAIKPSRIALYDQYGGSMPSGWVRWIMEEFKFPFEVIYPQDIDNGSLNEQYDIVLLIGAAVPKPGDKPRNTRMPDEDEVPAEFHGWLGSITEEYTVPELTQFMEKGGTVVTVGNSTNLSYHLNIGVENALVKTNEEGEEKLLLGTEYYVPGSILSATLDLKQPANWGMNEKVDFVFNNSPVFSLSTAAKEKGVTPLVWFTDEDSLRSGWAWGADHLKNGTAAFWAPVGKGRFYAFGPEITFRAQPHGTFKLLFNTLYTLK